MANREPVQPEAGLKGALWQAERGWYVLPVKPNTKTPHITKWQHLATTDEATIRKWWGKWPQAWVGGATGAGSGRLCLDVDQHKGVDGVASLGELERTLGELPDTEGQKTPQGWHLFFDYPEGEPVTNAAGEFLPAGLDVRGQGGYVVLAPSPGYTVEPGLLQSLPPGWLGTLRGERSNGKPVREEGGQPASTLAWLLAHPATEGGRNEWLVKVAGHLAKQTPFEDGYLEQVRTANLALQPPLPDEEVDKTAKSVWKAEQAKPAQPIILTRRPTEFGNAQRFVDQHGSIVRWCDPWARWLVWDGQRMAVDEIRRVEALMIETVKGIYQEAADADSAAQRKTWAAWAQKSESYRTLRASLDATKHLVPVSPNQLDAHPWLLNLHNGTLDLRTLELRPHRIEDHLTKLAPITYDERARCPAWCTFLDRVLAGDAELIEFVQRLVGQTLVGKTTERVLPILHGRGRNGKSTFLSTIHDLLGDYAERAPAETLVGRREGAIPTDVADLKGARFVSAVETEQGHRLAESQVKDLTGERWLKARRMRQDFFTFRAEFTIWLATNHKPEIRGTDDAIWDRIRLIPFIVRISDEEEDRELGDKLVAEASGILNWALEGLRSWRERGLGESPRVVEATQRYREEQDVLAAFLKDRCEEGAAFTEGANALYTLYRDWAEDQGERPKPARAFAEMMRDKGFSQARSSSGQKWRGLRLQKPGRRGADSL